MEVSVVRRTILALVKAILIGGACFVVVYATSYGFSPASTKVEWRLVDVPPHMSLTELADKLHQQDIIRSKVCFLAAARLSGESEHLQAGQYRLSPSMTPVEIVAKLVRGEVATEWVVIPEGSTLRQFGKILQKHALAKPIRFDAALRQVLRLYRNQLDLPAPSLEGYLFPDTYKIPKSMPETATVRLMVERFRHVVMDGLHRQIQTSNNGLSFADTLILASLIEKEAKKDEERPHIAGVLLNRLRNGTKLECDASIEYALPEHKSRLTREDLEIDSPYNTYQHRGLPPTPICSPGLPSIRAALNPESTHDLYYVAAPGGYHIFSQTLQEHRKAIARIRQMQAARQPKGKK